MEKPQEVDRIKFMNETRGWSIKCMYETRAWRNGYKKKKKIITYKVQRVQSVTLMVARPYPHKT